MKNRSLLVLVINLDKRIERFERLVDELVSYNVDLQRVSAITPDTLAYSAKNIFGTTPDVVSACWESHKKALEMFLQTEEEICLILEDDAKFNNSACKILNCKEELLEVDFDLLQIGFVLSHGKLDMGKSYRGNKFRLYLRVFLLKKVRIFLRMYGKIYYKGSMSFAKFPIIGQKKLDNINQRILGLLTRADNSFKLKESSAFMGKRNYLQRGDFQAGAHAYFVNRNTASFLLTINSPCYLATDLLYIALARAENLNFVRVTNSLVHQDDGLQSDIDKRSRLFG
jgi:GR25 family glycosyltransferase involved in LPS biosynthesis